MVVLYQQYWSPWRMATQNVISLLWNGSLLNNETRLFKSHSAYMCIQTNFFRAAVFAYLNHIHENISSNSLFTCWNFLNILHSSLTQILWGSVFSSELFTESQNVFEHFKNGFDHFPIPNTTYAPSLSSPSPSVYQPSDWLGTIYNIIGYVFVVNCNMRCFLYWNPSFRLVCLSMNII